jgi:acyl-CoA carboxylase subunit beta
MIENSRFHTQIEETNTGLIQAVRDVFIKCNRCHTLLYTRTWQKRLKVCDVCGYHFRLSASERIAYLVDEGSFVESEREMQSNDPLTFVGHPHTYAEKLVEEQTRTTLHEAVVIGSGLIADFPLMLAVMDFHFIGGSMGTVVGEKIARAAELACEKHLPLLIVTASGGARMQEGIFSLMQMAKVSVALAQLSDAKLPFIALLTDPTTGGVAASFGMQGDIVLAEPGALIGFAGPRVIEQFIHQKLPDDADTSEFALNHGMIDAVVPRFELRAVLARLIYHYHKQIIAGSSSNNDTTIHAEESEKKRAPSSPVQSRSSLSPWDQVQIARHKDRPYTADYIRLLGEDFLELRGDRRYANDQAIIGGLLTFAGRTVVLIGHQKGRDQEQRQRCGFGMPHPEGYRKAQRLMRHAEKFAFPVICLIDTPGAFPGLEAEQRGQAQAIAESLIIMSTLRVPTVAVVIGEGGSGGALALGLADRVLMMEHSIYTVASPEAAASILWRDNKLASQAAEAMRITAYDLLDLGVIDAVIPEPEGGAHLNHAGSGQLLSRYLQNTLDELDKITLPTLLSQRHTKFRHIDFFNGSQKTERM